MKALALSRCGAFCHKSVPHVNPNPVGTREKNVVTFYDYTGYYGHATHVNLSGGCVTLDNEDGKYLSIRTYGQCVVLYGSQGCQETEEFHVFQTERKSRDYYVQKLLTHTIPYYPKSVQLCGKEVADRDNCDAGESCLTFSSTFILWGIILLSFLGMVLISLAALGGVLIYRFFEQHTRQDSNTALLDVVFRSEGLNAV
ncbi:uncharacterized protein LOC118433029 [Folsomia candida]|nr:uncharacterized protein LOC118433029 [Folsomia candida]